MQYAVWQPSNHHSIKWGILLVVLNTPLSCKAFKDNYVCVTSGGICPRCICPLVICCLAWGMEPIWKLSGPPAPERMMAGRATEPVSTFPTLLTCCCSTVDLKCLWTLKELISDRLLPISSCYKADTEEDPHHINILITKQRGWYSLEIQTSWKSTLFVCRMSVCRMANTYLLFGWHRIF